MYAMLVANSGADAVNRMHVYNIMCMLQFQLAVGK